MAWDLIADIGGTNTRLARFSNGQIGERNVSQTGETGSILRAMESFISDVGSAPKRVMIAVAGTVSGGFVKVTNGEDRIGLSTLRDVTNCAHVQLINDFEAAAWSLAHPSAADITPLQGPAIVPGGNRIILGAGTGLGVGTLVATTNGFIAIPGEGGHVGITPTDAFERAVFAEVAQVWPEIVIGDDGPVLEAEALISGTGIPILFDAICNVQNVPQGALPAGQVFEQAKAGEPMAKSAVEIFKRHLARVAGNLAVSVSPHGGVFFAGGVVQQNTWILDAGFLAEFNAGGRFSEFRKSFPLYIYDNPDVGLIGSANALTYG